MNFLERWKRLWADIVVMSHDVVLASYTRWYGHYTESHRAYHSLNHIEECLKLFDEAHRLAIDPQTVEAALWWHDLIYDTSGATDNEQASADVARSDMLLLGCSEDFQNRVAAAILATKHTQIVTDPDQQLVLDIDLHTLGGSPKKYKQYCIAIRKEYSHVPWEKYVLGRTEILKKILARDKIFYHPFFQERYESLARFNIRHEVRFLTAHSSD